MATYLTRVVDTELDELCGGVAAIALEGPRAVGKTATAVRRARTTHRLDDPRIREIVLADPARALAAEPPVLLDEWQRAPEVWDAVRRAVDDDRRPGRFLLTGSASPRRLPSHSGAGRIVTVRMRPLSLVERGVHEPTVSVADLLSGGADVRGESDIGLERYVREIVDGGLPGLRDSSGRALRAELDGYVSRAVDRDVLDAGGTVRSPQALRRWLTAYAAATATTTTLEKIRDAATVGEGKVPARTTAVSYRRSLEATWLLDPVPGWVPSRRPLRRLATPPKHHLADPALAARLLRADADTLLGGRGGSLPHAKDGSLLGALFESLATLCVRVYAQSAEAQVGHLRTKGGEREIDIVLEGSGGRVVAMEVKLTPSVDADDCRHLLWLRDQLGDDVADIVIVTTGSTAYRRRDGVAVVPLSLLGP